MNRKSFFKKLFAGAVVAAVAPQVLAEIPEKKYFAGVDPAMPGKNPDVFKVITDMTPDRTPLDTIIQEWKETNGVIPFLYTYEQEKARYELRREMERAYLFGDMRYNPWSHSHR